jgi:hypothetical protein
LRLFCDVGRGDDSRLLRTFRHARVGDVKSLRCHESQLRFEASQNPTDDGPVRSETGSFRMKPRIGIISLSVVPGDPHVRKQGDVLANAGSEVTGIGLSGPHSLLPAWRCLVIDEDTAVGLSGNETALRLHASALLTAPKDVMHGRSPWRLAKHLKVICLLTFNDPAAALRTARAAVERFFRVRMWWCAARVLRNLLPAAREFNRENEGRLLLKACDRAVATADRAQHLPCNETVGWRSQSAE